MRKRAALIFLWTVSACGGQEPPPRAPETAPQPAPPKPSMQVRGELGSVDPGDVKRVFHTLDDQFLACEKRGVERVEVLSGSVKFFLRIGENGAAKWAYLEDSDLGDRATEHCLLEALMTTRWPRPDGGEAEARYAMDLPLQSTRPPNDWDEERVATAVSADREAIETCKNGSRVNFRATLYVGPHGHVLSAGVATSGRADEEADCLAVVLKKLKGLPSPGSWPAKVTFGL